MRKCYRTKLAVATAPSVNDMSKRDHCATILSKNIIAPLTVESVLFSFNEEEVVFGKLPSEQLQYYNSNVRVTLEEAIDIACNPDKQRSDFWMKERSKRLTTSGSYPLYTYSNNKHSLSDWEKKIRNYIDNPFLGNKATEYGVNSEPKAREWYKNATKSYVLETGLMINPSIPWLGYSPDGLVLAKKKIIEIKCPVSGKNAFARDIINSLKYIEINGENIELKKNHTYYMQIQLGMFVTNSKKCDFIIYSSFQGPNCFVMHISYDELLVKETYLPRLQYVYFSFVLKFLTKKNTELNNSVAFK